jgi:hypothetical protein
MLFFTAYNIRPAVLLAPVFTFSLSRMASTVRGLRSTISAISLVLFSSHISFKIRISLSFQALSGCDILWAVRLFFVLRLVSNALLVSELKKYSCSKQVLIAS